MPDFFHLFSANILQNFLGLFLHFYLGGDTGNLDEDTAQDITEILKESAHEQDKCVIVVTHSGKLAKQADVVFRLKKGELHRQN